MPGLSTGLNIGLSGLTAAQSALDVVGHNIANVNTPGYSREQAVLASSNSLSYGNLQYGAGVTLESISGTRNQLLNQQITTALSQQSAAQANYTGLQTVSTVFQDNGTTGIGSQLNAFFTGLQNVAAQPQDASQRSALVGTAQTLVATLQSKYQALQTSQTSADQQVVALTGQVNTYTSQIAALNKKLASESDPSSDNDAQDQRQALVEQLANVVGIQSYTDSKGQLNISLEGGGTPLVSGGTAFTMSTVQNTSSGVPPYFNDVQVNLDSTTSVNVTGTVTNGTLGAQLNLRDSLIPGYLQQMDQMAAGLAYNVNSLQSSGLALNGAAPTGIDFFDSGTVASANTNHLPSTVTVPPAGTAATDYKGTVMALKVNAQIVADPSLFAAAGATAINPATGLADPGDNTNVNAMVALQTEANTIDTTAAGYPTINPATGVAVNPALNSSGTFSDFATTLATQVETAASQWNTTATNTENIATALSTQRTSASGVDLDTEAANLITFQRGYQASAQFINVINTLTNQLLTTFGT